MTDKEIADKLERHQLWRRGELEEMPMAPKELGEVIDAAIERLRKRGRPGKAHLVECMNDIQKEMYGILTDMKGNLEWCECESCIDCDFEERIDAVIQKIKGGKR